MPEQKSDAWKKLWQEYSNSLKKWNDTFELFQKASNEIQRTFNEIILMFLSESSKGMMKFFGGDWQKAINEVGETWKKTKKDNNLFSQESENSTLSDEEIMDQFTDTKKGEPSRMSQENKSD